MKSTGTLDSSGSTGEDALRAVFFLPVIVQRLALMVQRVQKPVVLPQAQYLDKVVPCPLSMTGAYGQTVLKTAVSPQLQFVDEVVDISVVVQRQFPMVLFRTIELLQLQYTDKVIDVPVVLVQFPSAGVDFSGRWLPECFRISSVRQWIHIRRQSMRLLEEFHIFYVKDVPEVDARPGAVRTGNLYIISTSSSYDVADGFFAAFCGIFRTPSAWT